MEVAISIPDNVLQEAQRLAAEMNVPVSEIYRRAIADFVARNHPDAITTSWNRALDEAGQPDDPFVREAARETLERTEW